MPLGQRGLRCVARGILALTLTRKLTLTLTGAQGGEGEAAGAAGVRAVVHGPQRLRQEHCGVHHRARTGAARHADRAAGRRQHPARPQPGTLPGYTEHIP